jgi:hypothetical protein
MNDSRVGGIHGGGFALPFTANLPNNGRVNLSAPAGASGGVNVPGFGYQTTSEKSFQNDMLRGNWEHNPISTAFFSRDNLQTIQNNIRREVFNRSQPKGYVIDDQSVDELKIIMRSLYLQYGRNLPNNIPGQVAELNQRVLDWSVPHIMSAVDHYVHYLKDIEAMPVPLARSVHMSRAGTKSLPNGPFM